MYKTADPPTRGCNLSKFDLYYGFMIFTLQQIANAGAAKVDFIVNLWYNISKTGIVRIGNIYYFIGCFAPNNMMKGYDSIAVSSI